MIGLEEQISLFNLIGKLLNKKIECVVIGGSAMLFFGLKSATKDVDLVFLKQTERDVVVKLLENQGFEKRKIVVESKYKSKTKPLLLTLNEFKLDMFAEEVFSFKLSENMLNRIKEVHEFGNLVVKVVSPEDIIMLKCVTDRIGDRIDAKEIIKNMDINWNKIINECKWQTEKGNKIFLVSLYDFLEEINEMENIIPKPIIKQVRKLAEKDMIEALKKSKSDKNK